MHLVPLSSVAQQPWRNGGGTTRELLAWPPTDAAHWGVRVSVAHIGSSGPFSAWPGVERWFVVLQGAGVELQWQGHAARLTPDSPPLRFNGGEPPACTLLGGATEDLNLMLRSAQGALQVAQAGVPWAADAVWRGVFTTRACTLQAGAVHTLSAGTLAWSIDEPSSPWTLQPPPGQPLRAWWLHAEPA